MLKVEKLLAGYWRVTTDDGWANIKLEKGQWYVDIRNNAGDLLRYAGIWPTKREAVEEAKSIFKRNWI